MATIIPNAPRPDDGDAPRHSPPTLPAPPRATEGPSPGAGTTAPDEVEPRHRATGGVSAKERQHLARVARQAWEKCGAKGAGVAFDAWRHDQVADATDGKASGITSIRRGDYRTVMAHFLSIAGHGGRAMRTAARSGQGQADRDLALAKLRDVCESGGLAYPEYPESICRRQFRCGLDDLETGKVWFLFYTCTSRARAKQKKAPESAPETPSPDSAPVTPPAASDAQDPTGGDGETQL